MLHWSHKAHDILATAAGGSAIGILLSDIDAVVKLIIGILTCIFLTLGVIARWMDLKRKARRGSEEESEE